MFRFHQQKGYLIWCLKTWWHQWDTGLLSWLQRIPRCHLLIGWESGPHRPPSQSCGTHTYDKWWKLPSYLTMRWTKRGRNSWCQVGTLQCYWMQTLSRYRGNMYIIVFQILPRIIFDVFIFRRIDLLVSLFLSDALSCIEAANIYEQCAMFQAIPLALSICFWNGGHFVKAFVKQWVDCRNGAQLCTISSLLKTRCNTDQILNSQKTLHTSLIWAKYGVSVVSILEPHCANYIQSLLQVSLWIWVQPPATSPSCWSNNQAPLTVASRPPTPPVPHTMELAGTSYSRLAGVQPSG